MNNIITGSLPKSIAKDKIAAIISMLLGSVFIAIIGFSNIDVMHNVAHDTRHSNSFPCH